MQVFIVGTYNFRIEFKRVKPDASLGVVLVHRFCDDSSLLIAVGARYDVGDDTVWPVEKS